MMACIDQPVSWPRLEAHAQGRRDAAVTEHVAACAACASCLREIQRDAVVLPALVMPPSVTSTTPARPRWWRVAAPAMALAAAAVVMVVVWRGPGVADRDDRSRVKGVGEVMLDVVRERDGVIRTDVRSFAPGDRWKVVVTCPPGAMAWVDVAVLDARTVDHPLAPSQLACGNRIVLPGAFSVTGTRPNRVCLRIATGAPPPRARPELGELLEDRDAPDAQRPCVTLQPE